ncbi:LacI family DNA-binding transcriptional regulator [Roseomonas aeriglobus]|nr:LacI family DNA-binding transcriptional regulator [Roseomonas aeriglobus]
MPSDTDVPLKSPRRRRGGATVDDVARHAGVSPMTVSRVVNGMANVRAETRERVAAAIAALDYAPNLAARSLASAGDLRLGLLYANPSAAYLSAFLLGGLEHATAINAQLLVVPCADAEDIAQAASRLARAGVDGVILPAPLCDNIDVQALIADAALPAVAVASGAPLAAMAAVGIDDQAAARAMAAHLVAQGHRRIGFIAGNPDQTASARRFAGYREALAAADITLDDALVMPGLFTYRSGALAAERLLTRPERPSAIFACNDDMAAACVAVAHRLGLDVPRDLSVVGFDDTALATEIWPELTTIRQPIAEMARTAIDLLVALIRDRRVGRVDAVPEHRTLPFTLIRRGSDGAA